MEEGDKGEVTFNQAKLQQIRIDDRFKSIDRLSVNIFTFNPEFNVDNYQVVFQDLTSIFITVSYNLTEIERKEIMDMRDKTRIILRTNPPRKEFPSIRDRNKVQVIISYTNMDKISDALLNYRIFIESKLGKYGFSNPTKQDASKSAVKF